jgi:hypothetical protein
MPTLVWHSLTALLYDRTSARGVALAEALQSVSHDRLPRLLQADWSGQRLLELTDRTLFVWKRGYLIIDDTVLAQPLATALERLAWVYSRRDQQAVYGLSRVRLVWTHGTVRRPWACASGTKGAPPSMTWRSSGSATPATACAAIPTLCSVMPGLPPGVCSNGFATLGGRSCVVSRSIAASMATPCVTIGDPPMGPRLAG